MIIEKAVDPTGELLTALERLIPQLGADKIPPSRDELTSLINSEASSLLIARSPSGKSEIAGILTLVIYRVPTGIRSIVEDVIVDERFRRKGIAQALMRRAIEMARNAGASGVSLTSNPRREQANLMYQKLGFLKRETNSYYLTLK